MKNPALLFCLSFVAVLVAFPAFGQGFPEQQRYGYQPQIVPPPNNPDVLSGVAMGSGEDRFFLDRFGRRFKIYRARPFQPGSDSALPSRSDAVPTVPPAGENPLSALKSPVGTEVGQTQTLTSMDNRYPSGAVADGAPDLSSYPKPVADRDLKQEPILRRTEPAMEPVARGEWPAATKRPDPRVSAAPEKTSPPPSRLLESPSSPGDKLAVNRPQPGFGGPGQQAALPKRESPAVPVPEPQSKPEPPPDPLASLAYGKPVKGKKGFVTLEEHPNLPEIDVRGIAPGTPVEFPDPRDANKIIQFRVPKFD